MYVILFLMPRNYILAQKIMKFGMYVFRIVMNV
uniref:Uncharacterized protein n=1 Tax=Arundo donax TaxID=35708 RepID=A0A0A8Z486_ARUDO